MPWVGKSMDRKRARRRMQEDMSLDRLCKCGHSLGNHRANDQGECLGPTPGEGDCSRGCGGFVAAKELR